MKAAKPYSRAEMTLPAERLETDRLLLRPTEDGEWIELGYRLPQRMWGRGIASEGSRTCVKAAFEKWQVPEVMAVVDDGNDKSVRVLEKLAFKPHGKLHIYDMELDCFLLKSSPDLV